MIITDSMIQNLTEELSLQFFKRPFLHRAYINKRLRTTGGRYMLKSHDIQVNEQYILEYGEEELIGIIKHELCHYHLHLEGKGYKHGDFDFKKLLKETGSPRFCRALPIKAESSKKRQTIRYQCLNCRAIYERRRRMNTARYACGFCRGKIKEIKE